MNVNLDNQSIEVVSVETDDVLPRITLADGSQYYIAQNAFDAGDAAMKRWRKLIADPQMAREKIGDEVLINWALGREAGPRGWHEKSATSLNEWIDKVVARHPDVEFGHYAGSEFPIRLSDDLLRKLNLTQDAHTPMAFCHKRGRD